MESGSFRSTGTKRACFPILAATSRPPSSRTSPSTSDAFALAQASAIARPTPRAAPVTTMVRPLSIASYRRTRRGQVLGGKLLLHLLRQDAPHAGDPDVVLVEHLALVSI